MTVTTTYSFTNTHAAASLNGPGFGDLDIASLSDGGFTVSGFHYYHSYNHADVEVFDSTGAQVIGGGAGRVLYGTAPTPVAQEGDGNLVNVLQSGTSILFDVFSPAGVQSQHGALSFTPATGATAPENADVAGLAGTKFAVALDNAAAAGNHDIYVTTFDSVNTNTITVDDTTADDTAPTIATLAGGGFAVAWTRTDSMGHTSICYAVYDSSGSPVVASTVLDNTGTVNQNVSAVALDNGGFALAYVDNEYGASRHITLQTFDSSGTPVLKEDITADSTVDNITPSAGLLSNGYLAVSFTHEFGNNNILLKIIDPATGATIASPSIATTSDAEHDSAVTGFSHGGVAVVWNDVDDGQFATYSLTRTVTGDSHANIVVGDDLVDTMIGNGGNDVLKGSSADDSLFGGGGKDTLDGGPDADALNGGKGIDTASYSDAQAGVFASLDDPSDNAGDAAGDTYVSIENLLGSALDDGLTGDKHKNTLTGGAGDDSLSGLAGPDTLNGGDGDDVLTGGADADHLNGNGGHNTFNYGAAADSTGTSYDIVDGFNARADGFTTAGFAVSAIDAEVTTGTLSRATFNGDLETDIGAAQLGKHHAVLFTPNAGDLAGDTFLIIEWNDHAGYQTNKDVVIELTGAQHLGDLSSGNFAMPSGAMPPVDPITAAPAMVSFAGAGALHDHYGMGHFLV